MPAANISTGDLALAIRVATDPDNVPGPISTVLGFHLPAASELIEVYAPAAPVDVKNAAAIRIVGWMYDSDPADSTVGRVLELSGAAQLLQRFRVHRAGAIGTDNGGIMPSPAPSPTPGAELPPIPGAGSWILAVNNGELTWVEFPLP